MRRSLLLTLAAASSTLFLTACAPSASPPASQKEQQITEENQQRLLTNYPPPSLQYSAERINLIERLKRLNTENLSGCVYLVNYGTVMAFYPVKGKVTSLNAYLAGESRLQRLDNGASHGWSYEQIESPDFDGAYGKNSDGIFFFTADTNSYVEWHGDYLWSDQCLTLNQQPLMVRQVGGN